MESVITRMGNCGADEIVRLFKELMRLAAFERPDLVYTFVHRRYLTRAGRKYRLNPVWRKIKMGLGTFRDVKRRIELRRHSRTKRGPKPGGPAPTSGRSAFGFTTDQLNEFRVVQNFQVIGRQRILGIEAHRLG